MRSHGIAWLLAVAAGGIGATDARAQENVDVPDEIELPESGSPEGEAGAEDVEDQAVEPWAGTFAQGMGEVVRLAANEEHAAAMDVTERLLAPDRYARLRTRLEETLGPRVASCLGPLDAPLAWVGLESLDERSRAEVRYVRGLLSARTGALISADEELGLARALAGPGPTRNDAIYALGSLDLALAEELRLRIPEISRAAPSAPPISTAPGASSGGEEEPDPLELARAAYLEARAHLVERLQIDWRDADTRANTELVQRRLRELDEIERQREEQQEEQQDSQQQNSEEQEREEQESEDQESEDQESQDQESEQQDSEPQDSESEEQQEESEEDSESEEEVEESEEEPEAELEERILTQEEMMQLLEQFQRYQEQGEEMREQNRRVRRENVDKDW